MSEQFDRLHLNRNQLAAFLPDHDSIRQFEKLLGMANEIPDIEILLLEILAILSGIARGRNTDQSRIAISDLAAVVSRRVNLGKIERRLDTIESFMGIQ